MNDQDKSRFKTALTMIANTYDVEFRNDKIVMWWKLFNRHDIDQFEAAVLAHITDPDEGMFNPKPAHIIKRMNGSSKQNKESTEERAEIAWADIYGQIGRIGPYKAPNVADKQALAAVKGVGGWVYLCSLTTEELVWKKKEFVSLYDTYENTPLDRLPSSLPGLEDLDRHKREDKSQLKDILKESARRSTANRLNKQGEE